MNMIHLYKRGFTLIELLVVIAIIGVLASIVLASLDSSRKKGRDARRLADIKQLQLALELYYDQNNSFPASISTAAGSCGGSSCAAANLVTPGYISVVPTDPSNQVDYYYTPIAAVANGTPCYAYHLGTSLETLNHSAFQSDSDAAAATTICAGATVAADFNGADFLPVNSTNAHKCQSGDYGVECYDVKP